MAYVSPISRVSGRRNIKLRSLVAKMYPIDSFYTNLGWSFYKILQKQIQRLLCNIPNAPGLLQEGALKQKRKNGFYVRILFLWWICVLFECRGYWSRFSPSSNCMSGHFPPHLVTCGFPHLSRMGKGEWEVCSLGRSMGSFTYPSLPMVEV